MVFKQSGRESSARGQSRASSAGRASDLTRGSILGHVLRISIPSATGLVFNTLYNITDTYFGGRISTEALAGLSLSFPVFFIILSAGIGIGTATTALVSGAIGEGDRGKALAYFLQSAAFTLIISAVLFFSRDLYITAVFRLMGAQGQPLFYGVSYIRVIISGIPFFLLNNVFNSVLNAHGNAASYRNVLVTGFFLNLVLDPLFLYGYQFIPAMGMDGIAFATVFIQGCAGIYLFLEVVRTGIFCRRRADASPDSSPEMAQGESGSERAGCGGIDPMTGSYLIPKRRYMLEIASQSIPSALNMMSVALGMFIINYYLNRYGGTGAVAAYGIGIRIEQIALLPALGLPTALLAITGQNRGAKLPDRIKKAYSVSLATGAVLMLFMLSIILPAARHLVSLFTGDPGTISHAAYYLKIAGIAYYSYVLLFCSNSLLQGLKIPGFVLWAGLYRQIAAPLLFFNYICCVSGKGAEGVFAGIAIINWTAALASLIYCMVKLKKI